MLPDRELLNTYNSVIEDDYVIRMTHDVIMMTLHAITLRMR